MDQENEKYVFRNYGSESVDITIECSNYLLNQNFYENEEIVNIELLEKALIEYSKNKIITWKLDIQDEETLTNLDNLSTILEILNRHIPTQEERKGFFAQYTHCIIYLYSKIKNRKPIKWTHMDNTIFTMPYTYIMNQEEMIELITKDSVIPYEIPLNLLRKIKESYPQKKNPVLMK